MFLFDLTDPQEYRSDIVNDTIKLVDSTILCDIPCNSTTDRYFVYGKSFMLVL